MSHRQGKTPTLVSFTTEIRLDDVRPTLIIKSHSEPFAGTINDQLTAITPETGEVNEVTVLISQETQRGLARTPEQKFSAHVKDMGKDLRTRVYNALRWNIERNPEAFTTNLRVVYFPHGDSRIAIGMVMALYGFFGQLPEIANLMPAGGNLILNPEEMLLDLDEWRHMGRKLREIQQRALQAKENPTATKSREFTTKKSNNCLPTPTLAS